MTHKTIESVIRPVTIVHAPRLSSLLGTDVLIASEAFQYTGSFKFRAAFSIAAGVPHDLLIAASSGNFGQALAYACSLLKKSCIVVMPTTAAKVKVEAVREFGGQVEFVDVQVQSRASRVEELSQRHPHAYIASGYDDALVIQGNSSLGRELAALKPRPDIVVCPVGGGGLIAGTICGLKQSQANSRAIGAEPLLANDAARSLRAGKIVSNEVEPPTIADGARVISLGKNTWEVIRSGCSHIVEVPEERITEATRLLFRLANMKVEPTGALAIAALMTEPELFRGRSICCVVSGGNVDLEIYLRILDESWKVQST